jgi:hypothetical protein
MGEAVPSYDYSLRDEEGVMGVDAVWMGFLCFSKTLILCYIFVLNTKIELDA